MPDRAKRRYHSPRRQEGADATRQRILDAAREVMLERGYVATTMTEVAARAGVAPPTLYAAVPGGKAGLAKAVFDSTLAGDVAPIPLRARPAVTEIIAEPDPLRKIALYAAMVTSISPRIGPVERILRAAATTDPDAAALMERAEQQRLAGARGPVEHLHELGLLPPDLTVDQAAAQVYVLTSPTIFQQFTELCGWSTADYQRWLSTILARTLLAAD